MQGKPVNEHISWLSCIYIFINLMVHIIKSTEFQASKLLDDECWLLTLIL